ncbi:MAG: sigma-54-dependent Fis family transcriptional regulator [Deltaproteobacteria bacterium]|nr:sigma-54-dependent Fis family transcriptional regulator [Deltaproteobacteria bacterium]
MLGRILPAGKVLVVDDEEIIRESLSGWLQEDGLEVMTAESGPEALQAMERETFDLMLVDLKMPDMDGVQFLQKAQNIRPQTPVLIMTAYASVDTATQAIKEGAYDYVTKPFDPEKISLTIREIFRNQRMIRENIQLRLHLGKLYECHHIITKNQQMQEVLRLIDRIADSRSTVLIQGESGTGKELIAKAIHCNSKRASRPFIAVSCDSLPESLFEIALFGHEKETVTDAKSVRKGKFELADGGTLFLDEVGALSPRLQNNLLRALQEREFMRVGGKKFIHTDTRVISAASRDLLKGVQEGWFREDLYYRIGVVPINLPPLRERKEDIPPLVEHFISKYDVLDSRKVKGVNEEALAFLMGYDWPGNVRELESVMERAMLVNNTGIVIPADITLDTVDYSDSADSLSLQAVERQHITRMIRKNNWNIKKTAEMLKIDRATLCAKIKKFNLRRKSLCRNN